MCYHQSCMTLDKKPNKPQGIVQAIQERKKSFSYAGRGLQVIFKTQINFRIQCFLFLVTVLFGLWVGLYVYEWLFLVFSFGLLLALEAVNTAFEIDIDLTSPNYHPYAKDVKDVAAGAVLITAIMTGLGIVIIFLPKIL